MTNLALAAFGSFVFFAGFGMGCTAPHLRRWWGAVLWTGVLTVAAGVLGLYGTRYAGGWALREQAIGFVIYGVALFIVLLALVSTGFSLISLVTSDVRMAHFALRSNCTVDYCWAKRHPKQSFPFLPCDRPSVAAPGDLCRFLPQPPQTSPEEWEEWKVAVVEDPGAVARKLVAADRAYVVGLGALVVVAAVFQVGRCRRKVVGAGFLLVYSYMGRSKPGSTILVAVVMEEGRATRTRDARCSCYCPKTALRCSLCDHALLL